MCNIEYIEFPCGSASKESAHNARDLGSILGLGRLPGEGKREISPEYSLEGLMLKLKLQYFGHLMRRTDSFEKTLMLGKIKGRRRRQRQRMR